MRDFALSANLLGMKSLWEKEELQNIVSWNNFLAHIFIHLNTNQKSDSVLGALPLLFCYLSPGCWVLCFPLLYSASTRLFSGPCGIGWQWSVKEVSGFGCRWTSVEKAFFFQLLISVGIFSVFLGSQNLVWKSTG